MTLSPAIPSVYLLAASRHSTSDLTPKNESSFHVRLANKKKGGKQTKGKNPKLVSFTVIEGMRDHANDLENELIRLNRAGAGRRRIRQMIEEYRAYAKLVDLDA
jgi:hypothetical protein